MCAGLKENAPPQKRYLEVWPYWSGRGLVNELCYCGGGVEIFPSVTQCDNQLPAAFWSRCVCHYQLQKHICMHAAMLPVMMITDWTSEL